MKNMNLATKGAVRMKRWIWNASMQTNGNTKRGWDRRRNNKKVLVIAIFIQSFIR